MTKRKVTDLLETEAILISSDEERDAVFKLMDEAGMKWINGQCPMFYKPRWGYPYAIYLLDNELAWRRRVEESDILATDFIPTEMDEVEVDKFERSLKLLRDLADLQNGSPLEQHRVEWEQTMDEVYTFLNLHETRNTPNQ